MVQRLSHPSITRFSPSARRGLLLLGSLMLLGGEFACAEAPDAVGSGGGLATGGVATGGSATGGAATGGAATGGAAAGGASGGAAAGGASGGAAAGGAAAGGAATGGNATGGETAAGGGSGDGGAASGGASNAPAFSEIAAILSTRCAGMMCHGGTMPKEGIDFSKTPAEVYTTLTTKTAPECDDAAVVVPGDSAASAIVMLITGSGECQTGQGQTLRMPPMGMAVPTEDIDKIKAWIDAGAMQ